MFTSYEFSSVTAVRTVDLRATSDGASDVPACYLTADGRLQGIVLRTEAPKRQRLPAALQQLIDEGIVC